MARHNVAHQLQNKKVKYPVVKIDHDSDFVSIKFATGMEAASFERDGFLFAWMQRGKVIEVQIMNLSSLAKE